MRQLLRECPPLRHDGCKTCGGLFAHVLFRKTGSRFCGTCVSAFPEKVDTVMRGLVPRIHDFRAESKAWMAATSAAMTGHRFN